MIVQMQNFLKINCCSKILKLSSLLNEFDPLRFNTYTVTNNKRFFLICLKIRFTIPKEVRFNRNYLHRVFIAFFHHFRKHFSISGSNFLSKFIFFYLYFITFSLHYTAQESLLLLSSLLGEFIPSCRILNFVHQKPIKLYIR